MTKTEFIRKYIDVATRKGAFNLEEARALANCIDQLEGDLETISKETPKKPIKAK